MSIVPPAREITSRRTKMATRPTITQRIPMPMTSKILMAMT